MKSLGTRIALLLSICLFLVLGAASVWVDRLIINVVDAEATKQVEVQARTILSSLHTLMLNGQGLLARDWLQRMRGVSGVTTIEVLRRDGKEAFTDLRTVKAVNSFRHSAVFERQAVVSGSGELSHGRYFRRALGGQVSFDLSSAPDRIAIWMPIPMRRACLSCHGYDPSPLRGILHLSMQTAGVQQRIRSLRFNFWMLTAGTVSALGFLLWLMLRRVVLRPIKLMSQAMRRISEGHRDIILPAERRDELGKMARIFNRMRSNLVNRERRLQAVTEHAFDGMVIIDESGRIKTVNPAMARMFEYSTVELLGQNINIIMPAPMSGKHDKCLSDYLHGARPKVLNRIREETACRKDGTHFPVEMTVSEMKIDGQRYFLGILRDISSRKAQMDALRHQALHDALTGLPNRTLLVDRVEQAIARARREGGLVAVLYMDLDSFKEINDTLGHYFGDKVLQLVALQVQQVIRESDTLARLGGDEFSILLPGADEQDAIRIATKVREKLGEHFSLDGRMLHLGVSIGVVLFPRDGADVSTLIRHADIAMYAAKGRAMGVAAYDPALDHYNIDNLMLMGELRAAIAEEKLEMYFQPVIDLHTGRISGVEALVRWPHPVHGLLYPDAFIPMAERTGLIQELGSAVLKQTLVTCGACRDVGMKLTVAVNLSVKDIQDPRLPDQVADILADTGAAAHHLKLEITESAMMADPKLALRTLESLHDMGIKLAIDDFGTGFSSLAYLKELPVDDIKIDRVFVMDMLDDESNAMIVRSTIDLAHNMGLRVIAEGVENQAVYDALAALSCDEAQGYYMGRPLPVDELLKWIRSSPWGL